MIIPLGQVNSRNKKEDYFFSFLYYCYFVVGLIQLGKVIKVVEKNSEEFTSVLTIPHFQNSNLDQTIGTFLISCIFSKKLSNCL